jgi:DNA-binding NarL/FixJ family response regulator
MNNGRGSKREECARSESQSSDGSNQASSGVFRTAADLKRRESRWTVAETFEREGFSYRLMRRPLEFAKSPPRLTRREEGAVALACAGHTNKSIAKEMNVAPSTVGVLLFRAASKLNAKSRSELLSNYEQFKVAMLTSPAPPGPNETREKLLDRNYQRGGNDDGRGGRRR